MPHIFLLVYLPFLYLYIYYALLFSLFMMKLIISETWQLCEVTADLWCTVLRRFYEDIAITEE